jgi:hypothetical protein
MCKVGILYICTGKYIAFWEGFFKSYEKNFLPNCEKEYFVFTDAQRLSVGEDCPNVHRIMQEDLGWPGNTLFRFQIFRRIEEQLRKFDYLFFMNANCVCISSVTEEEFLPAIGQFLVVQHPGYYNRKSMQFPYDRQKNSSAYIPYGKGKCYVCGGVNGGTASEFLKAIDILSERIQADYQKGAIARWHDESQLNRYVYENMNYRLLTPAYCYPEGWTLPFEKKIMVRDKSKFFNVKEIKGATGKVPLPERLFGLVERLNEGWERLINKK